MKKIFLMALFLLTVSGQWSTANGQQSAVDLGLSVKWANMNVGASQDSGFGSYFAWGEIKPKPLYSWGTYLWSQLNLFVGVSIFKQEIGISLAP